MGGYPYSILARKNLCFSQKINERLERTGERKMPTSLKELEANRKRNIQKPIRVTKEELETIKRRMEKTGISSFNEYVVQMAMNGFILIENYENLIQLSKEVNYIGRNINQIAYQANVEKEAEIRTLQQVYMELRKIKEIIADAFKRE